MVDVAERDMDVDLSPRGEQQACALGDWLRTRYPTPAHAVLSSPYRRAERTEQLALERAGFALSVQVDERLRERDFGMLDRLTNHGIAARMPEQAEARARLGKVFYPPPGGENWAGVAVPGRRGADRPPRGNPPQPPVL